MKFSLDMKRLLAFLPGILLALQGCNTSGCAENRSAIPVAEFYSTTTAKKISTDSIEIGGVGAPNDSLIVKLGQKVSEVHLPFRSQKNSVAFYIEYKWRGMTPAFNDTIWISYSSIPFFASEECGAMYRYKINDVRYTKRLLDYVQVVDSAVANYELPNLRFYYPTAEEDTE